MGLFLSIFLGCWAVALAVYAVRVLPHVAQWGLLVAALPLAPFIFAVYTWRDNPKRAKQYLIFFSVAYALLGLLAYLHATY